MTLGHETFDEGSVQIHVKNEEWNGKKTVRDKKSTNRTNMSDEHGNMIKLRIENRLSLGINKQYFLNIWKTQPSKIENLLKSFDIYNGVPPTPLIFLHHFQFDCCTHTIMPPNSRLSTRIQDFFSSISIESINRANTAINRWTHNFCI